MVDQSSDCVSVLAARGRRDAGAACGFGRRSSAYGRFLFLTLRRWFTVSISYLCLQSCFEALYGA